MSAAGLRLRAGEFFSQQWIFVYMYRSRGQQTLSSTSQYRWLIATCPLHRHLTNGADWCQQFAAWHKNGTVTLDWPFHCDELKRAKRDCELSACQSMLTREIKGAYWKSNCVVRKGQRPQVKNKYLCIKNIIYPKFAGNKKRLITIKFITNVFR